MDFHNNTYMPLIFACYNYLLVIFTYLLIDPLVIEDLFPSIIKHPQGGNLMVAVKFYADLSNTEVTL